MLRKNSSQGFAHLGLVIVVAVVIAAVALGGWYVWHRNEKESLGQANNITKTTGTDDSQSTTQQEESIPDGFIEYTNEDLGFTLAYPENWTLMTKCQEGSIDEFTGIAIASNPDYLTFCGSDKPSQVRVTSARSNGRTNCEGFEANTDNFKNATCREDQVAVAKALRTSYTTTGNDLYPEGVEVVSYHLYDIDQPLTITYTRYIDWPDEINVFNNILDTFKLLRTGQ